MIFIHNLSDVAAKHIGENTKIWQFVVILEGATIGKNCNICAHVLIEGDVIIGDNVTIKPGVQIWDGARIGNNVFIGPNATFTNDVFPRSKCYPEKYGHIIIRNGASIGANATLLPNIIINENAMIGAGAVVTKDVPSRAVLVGNPGRIIRYINDDSIS